MAKETNGNRIKTLLWIIGSILGLATVLTGGGMAWENIGNTLKNQATALKTHEEAQTLLVEAIVADTDELEIDGCDPAKKNTFDIALFQKDMETMQISVKDMRQENKEGFKAIMERLPEK